MLSSRDSRKLVVVGRHKYAIPRPKKGNRVPGQRYHWRESRRLLSAKDGSGREGVGVDKSPFTLL
jgi:hypothetical protein